MRAWCECESPASTLLLRAFGAGGSDRLFAGLLCCLRLVGGGHGATVGAEAAPAVGPLGVAGGVVLSPRRLAILVAGAMFAQVAIAKVVGEE